MAEVASAYVTLIPSTKGFGRRLDGGISADVNRSGSNAGKGFGAAFGKAFVAVGAALGVGHFLSDSLGEAREAQKVGALTNQVIKTTGGVAKVSAKHVGDLSTAISNKTGVDDESIQSAANLLLTFKNVRNELGKGNKVFDRATQAAADLSAAGFGDLSGTSKQLGKALNDPVKGITALGRAGVTFTDQQKKQIKTYVKSGRTLEAQKMILKEVESQVGGAAESQATAGDKLGVSFKNLQEQVGTALLPTFDKLANFLVKTGIPAVAGLGPVFRKVGAFLKPGIEALKSFGDGGEAGKKLAQFKTTVSSAFGSLKSIFQSTVSIVTSLWNTFGESLIASLSRALTSIMTIVRGGLRIISGVFKLVAALLKGDWSGVWEALKQIASGALVLLKGVILGGLNTIKTFFSLAGDAIGAVFGAIWTGIKAGTVAGIKAVVDLVTELPGKILGAIGDLSELLLDAGRQLIQGLIDGVGEKFEDLKDLLGDITSKIPDLKGPPAKDKVLLRPNGRLLMDGLILGISDGVPALASSLGGLTSSIPKMSLAGVTGPQQDGDSRQSGGRTGALVNIEHMAPHDYSEFMREAQQRSRMSASDGIKR